MALLDMAIRQEDGKLAIAAIREARSTLQAMSTLTKQLATRGSAGAERADLDDRIEQYVSTGGKVGRDAEGPQQGDVGDSAENPSAPRRRRALRGKTLAIEAGPELS